MNREKRLNEKMVYERIPCKKDVAIQKVQMIDKDGNLQTEEKHVIIDESEMIAKIPAYTTKIEYMQQYGTLDENNIVRYHNANPLMDEKDVLELRNKILENGISQKNNVEQNKTE